MSEKLKVYQPYDRSLIEELDMHDASQAEAMLETAQSALKNPLKASERIAILQRTIELAKAEQEAIAMLIAREGGKPLADARVEAKRGVEGIENAIETLKTRAGKEIPMGITPTSEGRVAFTTHEPIGVALAVSAFNHPFNLIVHQAIPAVAVGCPVIVKPADKTPLSCIKLIEMLHKAGLPEAYCQLALTENDVTAKLVSDPRVAFFSFIGSSRVGWMLRSKLAAGTRCALEHGGAAPVIVDRNVDLDSIIPPIAKGGFYHAGQVCVSVQRIFVDQAIVGAFCDALTSAVKKIKTGDPTLAETEAGPLILPQEVQRVADWVSEAKASGANVLTGGKALSETCYEPTILLNPPADAKVSTQEIFGPAVCIYPYTDLASAIAQANALPFAFQASVFSENIDFALGTAKRLQAATVMINDHTAFRVDWMPFAGHKTSGYGTGGIPYTMEDMSHEKLYVIKSKGLEA